VEGKAELEDAREEREVEAEEARDRRDEGSTGADVLLGERDGGPPPPPRCRPTPHRVVATRDVIADAQLLPRVGGAAPASSSSPHAVESVDTKKKKGPASSLYTTEDEAAPRGR